jgi:ankyrin repeat protein
MRSLNTRLIFTSAVAILLLLGGGGAGPEQYALGPISAEEFVQAVATQRTSLIEFYVKEHFNPNARASQDRPLILTATLEQDWKTARWLLQAGASVDLADETGLTPLMAAAREGNIDILRTFISVVTKVDATDRSGHSALHCAIAARKREAAEFLLQFMPDLGTHRSELLATALDSGDMKIADAILDRIPRIQEWSASARRSLEAALGGGDQDQVRLLLKKHAVPPTPAGKNVPLLAYAIARNDTPALNGLLNGGADPNTILPRRCDKDFLALIPSKCLRDYVAEDNNVTVLMLAAGLGRADYVRALLDAGADRNRATTRYKMLALYLAAETGNWRCTQILLGSGPPPDQLHIEISLASQHVTLIKDGVSVFNTICSTGREGYSTHAGDYVITDKDRNHFSTIYKVEMPYFMRLNCLDFGMHEGVVPNHPASHGCIRLPGDAARKFFTEIPIGTLVTVK